MRKQAASVYLDPRLMEYIVALVQATRAKGNPNIRYGASPRGALALANASKALALVHGRNYVTPPDVEALVHDCLRHRIILSYEGLAAGLTTDAVLEEIRALIPPPVLT